MRKSTWTLSVILDEKTNYDKANKFVSDLADEIKSKLKKQGVVGIVVAKLEPINRPKSMLEK